MAFDQSTITEVFPPYFDGAGLRIRWTSSSPDGTIFQVYVNRKLAYHDTDRSCNIPLPPDFNSFDVGTVAADEGDTDFSASLPATPSNRAYLSWPGGAYLDPTGNGDVSGFHVYGSPTAGAAIDYATVLADIPLYTAGIISDGFGMGGYGLGGYGSSSAYYSWTSPSLTNGTWQFGVKPYDAAGNEGTTRETSIAISVPPLPPAMDSLFKRLEYTYSSSTHEITLTWLASPG